MNENIELYDLPKDEFSASIYIVKNGEIILS